ncbi:hypothetical protein ACH5RR_031707 [Cinchona calisaya]|uniref:GAG-pre-integrase domain-containing protein n=1 Tax=Cinchona calisaya TaxID=153742 RepID=A0ABD2YJF1_9GENT
MSWNNLNDCLAVPLSDEEAIIIRNGKPPRPSRTHIQNPLRAPHQISHQISVRFEILAFFNLKPEIPIKSLIRFRPKLAEGNPTTSSQKVNEPNKDLDVQVSFVIEECAFCCTTDQKEELALTTHVPGIKKSLLSVFQLTAFDNCVLFGPNKVKVYQNEKITGTPIMQEKWLETICESTQEAYVDKEKRNEIVDLRHARLGHVSYHKLKIMMMKSMLKGLPQLDVRDDIVCEGC